MAPSAEELYGLPLDRFVPERGDLARALRADGRRDEAAQVARLRKPSIAAWAVNQLVRTQRRAVAKLFDAGDAVRREQERLLAGEGDARALRAAGDRERMAVDALVDAARGLLSSEGHALSQTIVDRVSDTLHAAALDEVARETVRAGRLERDLRHVGLGIAPGTDPAPTQREQGQRAGARATARTAETAARRLAERAARALQAAEERRERAARTLAEADAALAAACAEAKAADDAHRRARDELDRA